MKKLLFIINAPSPYRWHTFNLLHKQGLEKDIDFRVAFMSTQSKAHPWNIENLPTAEFNYMTPWGFSMQPSRMAYINPGFIFRMLYSKWDWVIFGGYDMPTNVFLIALPLPRTRIKVIRNEGNPYNPGVESGPIHWLKRFLLNHCTAYLVPGIRGIEWLSKLYPEAQQSQIHSFLNAIDDEYFVEKSQEFKQNRNKIRQKWKLPLGKRVFLSPARLSPEKGIVEFIRNLPSNFGDKHIWIIAGDGPQRDIIEAAIIEYKHQHAIRLLGYVDKSNMPELYAMAEIFLLPSLHDPNPLSVIEAAFSGLPLLLSIYPGNFPELLIEGKTGWGFNPNDSTSVKAALSKALQATEHQIVQMGLESFKNANEKFRSELTCLKLLDFLLGIHPGSKHNGHLLEDNDS